MRWIIQGRGHIFSSWPGIDTDDKMNCFNWKKEENDWIVLEDHYNKESKNWQGPIHNC